MVTAGKNYIRTVKCDVAAHEGVKEFSNFYFLAQKDEVGLKLSRYRLV